MTKSFERHPDTIALVNNLRDRQVGQIVTYEDLGQILGRQITGSDSKLTSARQILLKDHAQVWDCERGQGVVRLTEEQIVSSRRDKTPRRMRNVSKRALAAVLTIDPQKLDDSLSYYAMKSFLGTLMVVLKPKSVDVIENRIRQTDQKQQLPIGVTLDQLKNQ